VLQASDVRVAPQASFAWQHAFGDIDPVAALAFASTGTWKPGDFELVE